MPEAMVGGRCLEIRVSADCAKTYNPEKWSLHSKKHKASSQAVVTLAVNWNELIARTVIQDSEGNCTWLPHTE